MSIEERRRDERLKAGFEFLQAVSLSLAEQDMDLVERLWDSLSEEDRFYAAFCVAVSHVGLDHHHHAEHHERTA